MIIQRKYFERFFVFLYFFVNWLFLPEGLLYTSVLVPFFLWLSYKKGYTRFLLLSFSILSFFFVLQFYLAPAPLDMLKSSFLLFSSICFAFGAHYFFSNSKSLGFHMKWIAQFNLLFLILAVTLLFLGFGEDILWQTEKMSPGMPVFPRFKGFSYEPSYYALLFAPIALYYILSVVISKGYKIGSNLLAVVLPLALSLSFGVIGAIVISLFLISIFYSKHLWHQNRFRGIAFASLAIIVIGFFGLAYLAPENLFFQRLENIYEGKDSSFKGRTTDSFELSYLIAKEKSIWFGVGLGQVKHIGHEIIVNYYKYPDADNWTVRLPNAVADNFASFGIIGLLFRFSLLVFLFVKTKVYLNIYRMSLFLFLFIYQFSGSFLNNSVEFINWTLCFSPVFPQFNLHSNSKQ